MSDGAGGELGGVAMASDGGGLFDRVLAFVGALRDAGVTATQSEAIDAVRALGDLSAIERPSVGPRAIARTREFIGRTRDGQRNRQGVFQALAGEILVDDLVEIIAVDGRETSDEPPPRREIAKIAVQLPESLGAVSAEEVGDKPARDLIVDRR